MKLLALSVLAAQHPLLSQVGESLRDQALRRASGNVLDVMEMILEALPAAQSAGIDTLEIAGRLRHAAQIKHEAAEHAMRAVETLQASV